MGGIVLIGLGIYIFGMNVFKLPFFWGSRKALRMRRLFGDGIASIIYFVSAIVLIAIGVTLL